MIFLNLGVGWVEERNPTPKTLFLLDNTNVQPNLRLFYLTKVIEER